MKTHQSNGTPGTRELKKGESKIINQETHHGMKTFMLYINKDRMFTRVLPPHSVDMGSMNGPMSPASWAKKHWQASTLFSN